jgi:transcriptional regulator with XRE-family HTH domain
MIVRESSPIARRKEVGALLRQSRLDLDLTVAEVAARLDMSQAKLSRLERGERGLQINDVRALAALYDLSQDELDKVIALARASRERGWWADYSDLDQDAPMLFGLEAAASEVSSFNALRLPGLLQTTAYAEALLTGLQAINGLSEDSIRSRVEVRERRQAEFDRSPAKHTFVLGEAVVRQLVGSAEVMHQQLERVLEYSRRRNVNIRVLPFTAGAHAGLLGTFTLMTFAADQLPSTVFVEGIGGSWFVDDPARVASYARGMRDVLGHSMDASASKKWLESLAGEWADPP